MRWLIGTLLVCICAPVAHAVTLGQRDDFDTDLAGWKVGGGKTVVGPTIRDDGPFGPYLHYETDTVNTGGRFLILNASRWTGNYREAGVTGLRAWVRNEGDIDLHLRLLLEGSGEALVSRQAEIVPVGAPWQEISLPISLEALTGEGQLEPLLEDVVQIRLFHNLEASFPGPQVVAAMGIDRIEAVPEPGVTPLGFGILGLLWLRRRKT